jgi:hypothetical protein
MNFRRFGFVAALSCATLFADPAPDEDLTPDLVSAINNGNTARIQQLLAAGMPATTVSAEGDTPLCAALRNGLTDVAEELLKRGADASACGPDHFPPVALASLRRTPVVMKMLLEARASPNIILPSPVPQTVLDSIPDESLRGFQKRESRVTPLMLCAWRGDVEGVSLLLKGGAVRDVQTQPHGFTALDLAAEKGFLYVMRLILGRHPEKEPQTVVTVNLSRQRAVLRVQGEKKLETSISTGRIGYSTPPGRYVVTHKYKEWKSTIYKLPMPFFMRLNSGNFGLHSGYVTGAPASHGCIRLPDAMARKFYDLVAVGDEVLIEE